MEEDERQKMLFSSEIESEIKGLDFQRERIFEFFPNNKANSPNPTHDADFYMILLRRLYRRIEDAQHDSRVGNLKGKSQELHKKIKIRDHFEHEINLETFPQVAPGFTVIGGVVVNQTNPHIISGDQKWLLNEDHEKFKDLLMEFVQLYPFSDKEKQKISFICRILKKLTKRFCKK